MHKKVCKQRAAEIIDEALFKQPPSRDDCPICLLPLYSWCKWITYQACCEKTVCDGCMFACVKEGKRGLCLSAELRKSSLLVGW